MFNNPFSLYTLSIDTFKDIKTGFAEVVSDTSVKVLKEEKYPNVYEALKKLEQEGKIRLISYDKESKLTKSDEMKMLENFVAFQKRNGKIFSKYDFEDMVFLHPNLLGHINEILLEENINNQIIKKEDLITILQKKLCLMSTGLKNEPFLNNGIKVILETYPELENYVKQSLEINNFNKEQLKDLYAKKDEFLSKKDFELYLTGSAFNSLDKPAIIDFGAGHSIYRTPLAFYEFQRLMKKFKNIVFLVPSEDKSEALMIINERVAKRGQNNDVDYTKINRGHLESPCNDIIATMKICTKGMNSSRVASEILRRIQKKNKILI